MTNNSDSEKEMHAQGEQPSHPGYAETHRGLSTKSSSAGISTDSVAYHPPNLADLSAMVRSPTRGFYSGTSLLYSTSGFDMLGVIARVGTSTTCIRVDRYVKQPLYMQLRGPNQLWILVQLVKINISLWDSPVDTDLKCYRSFVFVCGGRSIYSRPWNRIL
jgi:hypothetical protein